MFGHKLARKIIFLAWLGCKKLRLSGKLPGKKKTLTKFSFLFVSSLGNLPKNRDFPPSFPGSHPNVSNVGY